MADPATAVGADLIEALHATITHPEFPCLGARSVFRQNRAPVRVHDELNATLSRWETIRKFTILTRDLTEAHGELTTSLKVRRKVVELHFAPQLDAMYN